MPRQVAFKLILLSNFLEEAIIQLPQTHNERIFFKYFFKLMPIKCLKVQYDIEVKLDKLGAIEDVNELLFE